jgi:hypothetical protein
MVSRFPASEDGLVDQVALIRDGRLALHARVGELAAQDLTLSTPGILALAERQGPPRPRVAASA